MRSNSQSASLSLRKEAALARKLLLWPPAWVLLVVLLVGIVLAYQRPRSYTIDVGTPRDQAYVRNFHARLVDGDRAYRWSDVYGYVSLPGLGGSWPYKLNVELDPARAAPVTLIVNGETLLARTLQPGWQVITLRVDDSHPAALASRDTVLEIRAPELRTEDAPAEAKGVKVSRVEVEQLASGGFISPPYVRAALLLGAALVAYLFVGRALAGFATVSRARLWGLVAACLGGLGILVWLMENPVAVSAAASHVFVTSASMLALLVLAERGVAWACRTVGSQPNLASVRLVAVCVAVGFGLRYGGMALPQAVIIDMPWHMKWLQTLLAGNWQALYFPSEEGLSSVPREWGLNVLIPKSPLFYFAAAPLSLLPFDLETLVKWLTCLLDATLVLGVYWLALRVAASWRAAAWGAALYALMPLAFRAFAYGIVPTIFAQWLATAFLLALVALGEKTWGVGRWVGLTLLLTLALLAFPTVAVFLTLMTLALPLAWWLDRKARLQEEEGAALALVYGRIPVLVAAAWLLGIVAYYGLYVSPVIASAQAVLAPKPGGGSSTVRWPGGFPDLLAWTAQYVVTALPALLALLGLALVFAPLPNDWSRRKAIWLVGAWLAIAPLFVLVNYRVDMIGKHLFFTMVPVAVAGGVALWQLGRRGRSAVALASLLLLTVGWEGLIFWIDRLVEAST